jgi:hypothetical protein
MARDMLVRFALSIAAILICLPATASAQAWRDYDSTDLRGQASGEDEGGEDEGEGEGGETAEEPEQPWQGKNAFEVWEEEHRWFRLGLRAYGANPSVQEAAAYKLGAGLTIPLTTDFFMGIGMKLAFTGSYNRGAPNNCINRAAASGVQPCPDGVQGGVDYIWREPLWTNAEGDVVVDGGHSASETEPSATNFARNRRATHLAFYSLTIGGNYELTIPNIQFFRIFQPFFGGGVVIAWLYHYADLDKREFVLIDNDENDVRDDENIDPWSDQGPEVGGEVYGGFHLNLDEVFRFTFEIGYHNIPVARAYLNKATEGYEAQHLDYALAQLRFGGGFEFRF